MINGNNKGRGAFTLIELLVVIALIMILAGLAVAFLPSFGDNARAARGATMLQQWILTAKQKVLRDQAPGGLRLNYYVDPATGKLDTTQVRQCQYLEQPDDFPLNVGSSLPPYKGALSTKGNVKTKVYINLNVGTQVAPDDYLEVQGCGLMHRITRVQPGATSTLTLTAPGLPYPILTPTTQYRIVRAPRISGDDLLELPDPVIIDLKTNATSYMKYKNTLTANADNSGIDIIFSPTGEVISRGTSTDFIALWVREHNPVKKLDVASATTGEQTILAIFVRSGLIVAHPPAPGPDPYLFIKDGRTSGK